MKGSRRAARSGGRTAFRAGHGQRHEERADPVVDVDAGEDGRGEPERGCGEEPREQQPRHLEAWSLRVPGERVGVVGRHRPGQLCLAGTSEHHPISVIPAIGRPFHPVWAMTERAHTANVTAVSPTRRPHARAPEPAARSPADPRRRPARADHVRRQGSGHVVPADRAAPAAGGCPQRADRAHRRHRLRGIERLRRPLRHADGRATGGRRLEVQPLPHHCPLLADASGAAHRSKPSLRRHGRHHRNRNVSARLQLDPAEHHCSARGNAEAERVLDRAIRQVP